MTKFNLVERGFTKFRLAGLSLTLIAAPAHAHDFWIQPQRFQVAPNTAVPITFQVGHGDAGERWLNNDRIVLIADFFNGRRHDRRAQLRTGGPADFVTSFPAPGLHILGMQTNSAFSELPASRFNEYAAQEGLITITATRKRDGKLNKPGRERYSRRAKALIQVGPRQPSNLIHVIRPIGLKLEIVPDRDPYDLGASRQLPLHVLYRGRRLPNALVKLTRLEAGKGPVATAITDQSGRASFRIPVRGNWLVSVVWAEALKGDRQAEFDTTFSSLTFGYGAGTRR